MNYGFVVNTFVFAAIFLPAIWYLICFKGLKTLDIWLSNSFTNFYFKDFSAEFTAKFTYDSLMWLYILASLTS